MSDTLRTITVPGKPMTWARARISTGQGRVIFRTADDRRQRMGELALFWQAAGHGKVEKGIAIGLRCEFVFDRPDGHSGTGRNAGVLKESARHKRPTSGKLGGDLDNLVKLVKDGLNNVAYYDDSQVAELQATKRYVDPGEQTHTKITLVAMDLGFSLPEPEPHTTAQLALA